MPHDPMLVEAASLPPGYCFTCGTVEGPFVDTMCSANHDTTRVYLCVRSCVTRFAALAGLSDAAEVQGQLDDTLADLAEAESKLTEQEPIVSAVKAAFPTPTVIFPKGKNVLAGSLEIDGDVAIVGEFTQAK